MKFATEISFRIIIFVKYCSNLRKIFIEREIYIQILCRLKKKNKTYLLIEILYFFLFFLTKRKNNGKAKKG